MRRRLLASGLTASMLVACNAILGLDGDSVIGSPDGSPAEQTDGATDATVADGNLQVDGVVPGIDAGPSGSFDADANVGDADDDAGDPLGIQLVVGVLGGAGYGDGKHDDARFTSLDGLVRDTAGNRYVIDGMPRPIDSTLGTVIRKISPSGDVSTLAGTFGVNGYHDDDIGTAALFTGINAITYDGQRTLYATETTCHVRSIDTVTGKVSTFAGLNGCATLTAPGKRFEASFKNPTGIVVGKDMLPSSVFGDAIFIADPPLLLIYRTSNDTVTKVCGAEGVPAPGNCNSLPMGGTDLVWDDTRLYYRLAQSLFRFVPSQTTIEQLSGSPTTVQTDPPSLPNIAIPGAGLALESSLPAKFFLGNVTQLRYAEEATGLYQTKAGSTDALWLDGALDVARFERISGLARNGTSYDIADLKTLRSFSGAAVTTIAGLGRVAGDTDTQTGIDARINTVVTPTFGPKGLVYFFDRQRRAVRSYDPVTHDVKRVAGGTPFPSDKVVLSATGDGLVFDGTTLIFSTTFKPQLGAVGLKAIDPETMTISPIIDEVSFGSAMTSDGNGTVYTAGKSLLDISSWTMAAPEKLFPVVGQMDPDASTGTQKAIFGRIGGMCFDAAGKALVVLDQMRSVIYRVDLLDPMHSVTKIAGGVIMPGYEDGLGISARFGVLDQVTCDGHGFAYVSDEQAGTLRRVNVQTGETHEVAGTRNRTGVITGPLPGSLNTPTGLLALPNHHVLAGSTNEAVLLDIHVSAP